MEPRHPSASGYSLEAGCQILVQLGIKSRAIEPKVLEDVGERVPHPVVGRRPSQHDAKVAKITLGLPEYLEAPHPDNGCNGLMPAFEHHDAADLGVVNEGRHALG
ncbi:MAG: hypothetical protein ACYC19_04690 [Acidimicrobiales bacterium]